MIRVLIVDDHHAARTTLRELLDWHSFQVCGDTQNGKEAIEKVRVEARNSPDGHQHAGREWYSRRWRNPTNRAPDENRVLDSPRCTSFRAWMKPWAHGFVCKSEAGRELIPTLERVAGITASETTIECSHCKVRQNVHVATSKTSTKRERQYFSCVNCHTEFDVKVADKVLGGPFVA